MKQETPFKKRCCYDCAHMKAVVSWWCTSPDAIKARGTQIPGIKHCKFWKPDWHYIAPEFRTAENGYIEPVKPKSLIQRIKSLFS